MKRITNEEISEAIQMGDFRWVPTNNEQFWDFVINCCEVTADAQLDQCKADQEEERRALGEWVDDEVAKVSRWGNLLAYKSVILDKLREALKRGELPEGMVGE
jgi:hypothetical protein